METKLIIVTGMSGAGKSTTARNLAQQFRANQVPYRWLHEEIRSHPIRDGEFRAAPLDSEAGMERNIQDMFDRWERLVRRILRSKRAYILEAVLYENIIRYFFVAGTPREKVLDYYDRLMQIMEPANPAIVFLYRSDVQTTLEAMYAQRGNWWKNLILDGSGYAYFRDRELAGEAGVYAMWEAYQALADSAFQQFSGRKIKVDTTAGDWDPYNERIVNFLGLAYHAPKSFPITDPEQYCGKYAVQVDDEKSTIEIHFDGANLYCSAFWPYMKLVPLGRNRFEFSAFPVTIAFVKGPAGFEAVTVSGTYDWEIVGTTMVKEPQ